MSFVRGVTRGCGPGVILVGLLFRVFSHVTLLRLVFPFRFIVAQCLVAGGLVSAVAWFDGRRGVIGRVVQTVLLLFASGGLMLGVVLYRAESLAYHQHVISFEHAEAHLVGTLYLPNGSRPHAGIVIVHGSGRLWRQVYHLFADHFVRAGYAVLLYDKRGVGASSGHYEGENNVSTANIELLAGDAAAALRTLASRSEVRPDLVGFWGVSQAGWIIPRAAVLNGHAAFMILVSGPTTTTGEEMEYSRITGDHEPATGMVPRDAERLMAEQPPSGFDPAPDLHALNIPGLWLQGDRDWSIPVLRSVDILDRLVRSSNKPYEYQLFSGAGHAIFLPYKKGERLIPELAPGYWQITDGWLQRLVARGPSL